MGEAKVESTATSRTPFATRELRERYDIGEPHASRASV